MTAFVVAASVAPLFAEPNLRSEQVSQMLLGETGEVLEEQAEWLRVRASLDRYEGWAHRGYLTRLEPADAAAWRERAAAWSDGARIEVGTQRIPLPLGARVALENGRVTLPDGRMGRATGGTVRPLAEVTAEAAGLPAERWALSWFEGSPYQWGGRTPWGVDCSGLVQTAFAARGVALPRDSSRQAEAGRSVSLDQIEPGDLLFFHSENGTAVTHVAFAGPDDTLIHSTVSCGGVLVEPRGRGSRAEPLMRRLVAARRVSQ